MTHSTNTDDLTDLIRQHQTFLFSDRCLEEAWDEARDQMPDHLTSAILAWFQDTTRFDTVFQDWMRGE